MLPSVSIICTPNLAKAEELSSACLANCANACRKPRPAIPASKARLVNTSNPPNNSSTLCPVATKKGIANLTALDKSCHSIKDLLIAYANLSVSSPAISISIPKPRMVWIVNLPNVLASP